MLMLNLRLILLDTVYNTQQAHDKSVVEEPCSSGWCLKVKRIVTFIISINMNISIINIINVKRIISIIIIAIIKEKASTPTSHCLYVYDEDFGTQRKTQILTNKRAEANTIIKHFKTEWKWLKYLN